MFGRGRGSGPPPPGARLRDDDGTTIALNAHTAPPELFPPVGRPLPTLPVLTPRDEELLKHKRALDAHWRASCFNLPLPSATAGGEPDDVEVERYSDRVRKAQAPPQRVSLREVVGHLESRYFPRELWATRKHSRGRADASSDALRATAGGDIARLDRLADAEQRATAAAGGGGRGGGDGDEDDDMVALDDDDDALFVDRRTQSRKRTRLELGVGNIDDDDDDAVGPPAGGHSRHHPSGHGHGHGGADRDDDDGTDGDDGGGGGDDDDDDDDDDYDLERFDDDDGYDDVSLGGGDDDGGAVF